jgi:Zn-dependent protease with chaperone function
VTFELRILILVLAAFAAASLAASVFVPASLRRAARHRVTMRPDVLFSARVMPAIAGALVALASLVACLAFEPRGPEGTGVVLPALAAVAAAGLALGAGRWLRTIAATRRAMRRWMQTADPVALPGVSTPAAAVDSVFPIVAVVGLVRPRLVIARSVLAACPADELEAILAHERHHIARRDNLKRALLIALPDPLSWWPASRRWLTDWHDAAEDAADEAAGRLGEGGRLLLAQALIRVARLTPPGAMPLALPACALYRGGSLERRVRRLLEPDVPTSRTRPSWLRAAGLAGAAGAFAALDTVHQVIELAVTQLP